MSSISMAQPKSKPRGLDQETIEDMQKEKNDNDQVLHVNMKLQALQFGIDDINKCISEVIAKQGSFEVACMGSIQKLVENTKEIINGYNKTISKMQLDVDHVQTVVSQMLSYSSNFVEKATHGQHIQEVQERIKEILKDKNSLAVEVHGLIDRLKIDFSQRMAVQKNDILSIPSELPSLRKDIDQKIELVELNGQNAHLRSSNNEKAIMLLERKLDQVYQLLKQIQIANKEKE